MTKTVIQTFVAAFAYALVRYAWFHGTDPVQIPVYLVNKALSVAAVCFLLYAAFHYSRGNRERSKEWGRIALHAAVVHIVLSLAILKPSYFPDFFGAERMSLKGELMVFFGAVGIYLFWIIPRYADRPQVMLRLKRASCFMILLHLVSMGIPKWIQITNWPGYLPNMSLLSALVVIAALSYYSKKPGGHASG